MICPKCGQENEQGAPYCTLCYERFWERAPRRSVPTREGEHGAPVRERAPVEHEAPPGTFEIAGRWMLAVGAGIVALAFAARVMLDPVADGSSMAVSATLSLFVSGLVLAWFMLGPLLAAVVAARTVVPVLRGMLGLDPRRSAPATESLTDAARKIITTVCLVVAASMIVQNPEFGIPVLVIVLVGWDSWSRPRSIYERLEQARADRRLKRWLIGYLLVTAVGIVIFPFMLLSQGILGDHRWPYLLGVIAFAIVVALVTVLLYQPRFARRSINEAVLSGLGAMTASPTRFPTSFRVLEEVSIAAGLKEPPGLSVIYRAGVVNAFVIGRLDAHPAVVVTEALADTFDAREQSAVFAHLLASAEVMQEFQDPSLTARPETLDAQAAHMISDPEAVVRALRKAGSSDNRVPLDTWRISLGGIRPFIDTWSENAVSPLVRVAALEDVAGALIRPGT
ncbi:MAG: M48 family metalloprotease [Coriobacteriia bacterium]|nr:M48 family metalloprotease [Coriobacteriia bacterium]